MFIIRYDLVDERCEFWKGDIFEYLNQYIPEYIDNMFNYGIIYMIELEKTDDLFSPEKEGE